MRPSCPSRRPGAALVVVLAQLILLSMACALAHRQGLATIGLEEALRRREERQAGSLAALAVGLGLLETGLPGPEDLEGDPATYRCFVEFPRQGSMARYTLTFERLGPDEPPGDDPDDDRQSSWSVSAAPYRPEADFDLEGPILTFAPD